MKLKRHRALNRLAPHPGKGASRLVDALRRTSNQLLSICALFARLVVYSFGRVGRRIIFRETLKQIYFTALQAIDVVIYSSLVLGMLIIVHATQQLAKVQGEELVGWLLVTVVVRELGPLLVAFIVVLRSCTAIIVELGNMSVAGEIDALNTMGIDPYRYLGIPRFWGLTISVAALNVLNTITAIFGGFLFAKIFAEVFWGDFWRSFFDSLEWFDLADAFSRSISFGMVIATVSVYFGFKPQNNLGEVVRYTAKGAVLCLLICATMDLIMVIIYYL